jgi:hypothetical protein
MKVVFEEMLDATHLIKLYLDNSLYTDIEDVEGDVVVYRITNFKNPYGSLNYGWIAGAIRSVNGNTLFC